MNDKIQLLGRIVNQKLGLFLSISFGVFLFILFFQPFPLDRFDFNNNLLFVAGFGGIIFLMMFFIRIANPWMLRQYLKAEDEPVLPSFLNDFIILILSSVAFAFYLRYVGSVSISFYIIFKVVLVCLASPIILRLYDRIYGLKQQQESLIVEKKRIQNRIEEYEESNLNKSIEFDSENNKENLTLLIRDVALIKSADNYVEIVYKEEDQFRKKLIRNTLKHIELQLKPYSNFIRCHRICIINTRFIDKLNKSYGNQWIAIKGYPDQIPVSRQYLIKIKELL